MKIEYLRHEYTWSSQCITGTRVGWGITGSSTPLDKERLVELEKLASGAVSDPQGRIPIESLVYSPSCGFTKMVTVVNHEGEDRRKSKKVHIYQVAEMVNMVPESYLTPGDVWDDEKIGDYYEPIKEETIEENVDDILVEMGCYDRLPDFLQILLESLLGEYTNMNIVADWPEEDFAKNSQRLMYAVHNLIPEPLRKKASYQSFSRGEVSNVTFYFSREPIGEDYIKLGDELHLSHDEEDELRTFFYHRLAESYVKKDTLYPDIMDKVASYYTDHGDESNTLKKLQWILCALCIKEGEYPLTDEYIMREVPQLFYWCDEDLELKNAVDIVLEYFHTRPFDSEGHKEYQNSLIQGYTKRSESLIGREMTWSMKNLYRKRVDVFKSQLKRIQQRNSNIYTLVLTQDIEDEKSFAAQLFASNNDTFEQMRTYLLTMNMDCASDAFKDICLVRGIDLLNTDLFNQDNFKAFDELVKRLGRQEQGAQILKNFIGQLENMRTNLDDERLEVGCYVEGLLNEYEKTDKYNLLGKERAARQIKKTPTLSADAVSTSSITHSQRVTDEIAFSEDEVKAAKEKQEEVEKMEKEVKKSVEKQQPQIEKHREKEESFLAFLLHTLPMGFITGCTGFVIRYSMRIGHDKIALGMVGIWVIVMMNYLAYLQIKQRTIRTWQTIGLCVTEGLIIAVVGLRMVSMHWHLIYFIILGVIALLLSLNNLLQEREHRLHR